MRICAVVETVLLSIDTMSHPSADPPLPLPPLQQRPPPLLRPPLLPPLPALNRPKRVLPSCLRTMGGRARDVM
ncbi:hypothetical protein FS842_004562 [Serendipita sp. 407]|nr:hypothetical protein FS842_004562 [Serendipita sp. 407]